MTTRNAARCPSLLVRIGLATAIACAGCGGGLTGIYATQDGARSLEFRANGTVYVTVFGGTFEGHYQLDGNRVIVKGPGGAQVYTQHDDRLDAGFGVQFERVDEAHR